MKIIKTITVLFLFIIALQSCSEDDNPVIINEEELITTVTAIFTPDGGGENITLRFQDLDGEGGNTPNITVSSSFEKNKTYRGSVTFLNEFADPAQDVTPEIKTEADEHQMFYITTGSLNAFTYDTAASNFDANGLPLGLQCVFTTTGDASGTVTMILRHKPNKSASGVPEGIIDNANGSTDVSVTFSIDVK
ncbi:hypothetical protein [Jejuia pallidilutea]|jgi:hypothetical protein|uniref:Type 1 periplasmic binding fold superfamily protein n=1 Tax=Jejuia pallidilutea TaxID=504487 RepID=A0A090W5K6_9FLAO|nr:hypothetical protein [Jejuia pallidilutea]GAL68655.1 hypothetical protein JCM19301_3242 [Jejuia pallidilutea]GAL72300.1 hypothetical protein JCM19302_45 [Jejuia pallidilutea]GAL89265.1 hypothetical protein JCM19538_3345 [Jejuia pallidilutea]